MTDQVLQVELSLGVEFLEAHLGALAEAALDRSAAKVPLVVYAHVDAATGHPGARPGADVAEDHGAPRCHVLEGEALGVGAINDAAPRVVERLLRLARQHHVGAGEADAEARVGRSLDEEVTALGAVSERLADRPVHSAALAVLPLQDRDGAAQHRLPDAVLGPALDPADDAPLVEGAEALAGDRAPVEDQLGQLVGL